jgi:hypothetical protein
VSFTGAADGILVECLAVERPAKKHAQRSLADHGEVDHRAHSIGVLLGKGQDLTEHLGLHTGLLIGLGRGPCCGHGWPFMHTRPRWVAPLAGRLVDATSRLSTRHHTRSDWYRASA